MAIAVTETVLAQCKEEGARCTGRTRASSDAAMRQNGPALRVPRDLRPCGVATSSFGTTKLVGRALPGRKSRGITPTDIALAGPKWLNRALSNLKEEANYIAQDDPQAAARIVILIEEAVALLADHPSLGRTGRVPGTRELVVAGTPYLVPYRVRAKRIDILRVFHSRRRWPSQL